MKITVLGCGTSGGVPRVGVPGGHWGACDPANPKNRRRRVSVLVVEGATRLLIDTSPDLREQLIDANVTALDGVLITHDHADHTHGIDDLRALSQVMKRKIPIYADARTLSVLRQRFDYIFEDRNGYPAICQPHVIDGDFQVNDVLVRPFEQDHGPITSLGFRINDFAYSTDLKAIPEKSERHLAGLQVWLVDALRREPHPTHPHLELTLSWIEKFKPAHAVLTHMDWSMDYDTLMRELPSDVVPGYDGMMIEI
jgi:phosphoribosyl 1,2-cyclic phosphate phosphodiesterase